jgi:hypothetical protein
MKSNKQMVFEYLDEVHVPLSFHGRNLKKCIFYATGKDPYTETILKYAREYSTITGAKLICLGKKESKYNFVPGRKMYLEAK